MLKKLSAGIVLSVMLFTPLLVGAQAWTPVTTPPDIGVTGEDDVYDFLNTVSLILFNVLMILSVIMILWAGFMYITAGGNEQRVEKAKKGLLYAVIGIVIALLAWSIPQIIIAFISA